MSAVDIATLGIGIDSTQVETGTNKLGGLTKAGAEAEKQTKETTAATAGLAAILRETIAAIQGNTAATNAHTSAMGESRSASAQAEAAEAGLASARRASEQAAREAAAETKRLADEERRASKEAEDLANRVNRLQQSVQPFTYAQEQANAELLEAETLYRQGAISAEAYAQAQTILTTRAAGFAQRQDIMNSALIKGAGAAKLTATETLNLSRQFADIGVTAAMGMNPLMILIQQGPQIADVLQTAGQRGLTATAVFKAMGTTLWAALAPALPILAAVGVAVGAVAAAWGLATRAIDKDIGDNIDHLKLNERQLERLKEKGTDTGITMGDTFRGLGTTIKEYFTDAFGEQLEWLSNKWTQFLDFITAHALDGVKNIIGPFTGAVFAIAAVWEDLPAIFSDIAVTAANGVIAIVEGMVNKVVGHLNRIGSMVNKGAELVGLGDIFGEASTISLGRIDNPNAGAASRGLQGAVEGYQRGDRMARGAVDAAGRQFMDDWGRNSAASRDARVTADAGDPGKDRGGGRRSGMSDAEKEYERQVKAAQEFVKSLKEETEELGKNAVQVKMMGVERAAAAAPTAALAAEIRAAGDAWKAANDNAATDELLKSIRDLNEETAFNNSLEGMNARERASAVAQREIDIRLRDLERQGINVNTDAIKAETDAYIANARARGELQFKADEANEFADAMASVNSRVQDAVAGLGDLAGAAGETFGQLLSLLSDYGDHQASVYARIAQTEAQYGKDSQEANRERARSTEELAQAEINHYGNMLSAAKGFFDEKSTAYKVLQAAETAYRLYQFAMAVQAMFFDTAETTSAVANAGVRMGVDAAETASSVSKSGIRAAADGVAAFARTLASLPFPFNIAAGAVVLAALVGVGVAMGGRGGGGSKSATASAASAVDEKPSTYTPFISHDTNQLGGANDNSRRYGGISPNSGYQANSQAVGNSKTNVFDFSGANFGNSDPEQVKSMVRQGIEEAKPDLLADARDQNIADMKAIGRARLGG